MATLFTHLVGGVPLHPGAQAAVLAIAALVLPFAVCTVHQDATSCVRIEQQASTSGAEQGHGHDSRQKVHWVSWRHVL